MDLPPPPGSNAGNEMKGKGAEAASHCDINEGGVDRAFSNHGQETASEKQSHLKETGVTIPLPMAEPVNGSSAMLPAPSNLNGIAQNGADKEQGEPLGGVPNDDCGCTGGPWKVPPDPKPLPFWPWPKKGSRITPGTEKEDPFTSPPFWWIKWIAMGMDRSNLNLHEDDHLPILAERFGWKLPPVGDSDHWTPLRAEQPKLHGEIARRVNMQTMFYHMGLSQTLCFLVNRKRYALATYMIIFFCLLFAVAWATILAVVPIGDIFSCKITEDLVWVLFTNPFIELSVAFAYVTVMFGALDHCVPWRPFKYYGPVLAVLYLVQVTLFLPISWTVGSFSMTGLVCRLVTYVVTMGGMEISKPYILGYDVEKNQSTKKWGPEMEERWGVYRFVGFQQAGLTMVMFGYGYGIKVGSESVQKVLLILLQIIALAARKTVQHRTTPLPRPFTFILSGLWPKCIIDLFAVWSTANFKDGDEGVEDLATTYLLAALSPLSMVLFCTFEQSHLWFRFRCFIRSWPKTLFTCKPLDPNVIPIEHDMDFDGRGCTNAHPDYRRGKVNFAFYEFLSLLVSYTVYLAIAPVLRYGPNTDRYPFGTNDQEGGNVLNGDFSDKRFWLSMVYALLIAFILLVWLHLYILYIRKWYPQSWVQFQDLVDMYKREPHMAGFLGCILASNVLTAMNFYLINARLWYANVGDSTALC